MIKIIGMILVVLASSIVGFYIPKIEKRKIDFLIDFKQGFGMLKNEINYSLNSLVIGFLNIHERSNNQAVKQFFINVYRGLETKNGVTLKDVWEENVAVLREDSVINENEEKCIAKIGSTLGYLDKDAQVKNIELLMENIEEMIINYKEKHEKNSKLYSRMGILFGVMIAVVMI